jgi:hypothetical protein
MGLIKVYADLRRRGWLWYNKARCLPNHRTLQAVTLMLQPPGAGPHTRDGSERPRRAVGVTLGPGTCILYSRARHDFSLGILLNSDPIDDPSSFLRLF